MAFKLPKLIDLSDDQLTILNAPYDQNMIVSGAPGTGKSVLAIYRAADLSRRGRSVLLLVYNKPLQLYISGAVRSLGISANVYTYHSWLREIYSDKICEKIPKKEPQDEFNLDFSAIAEDFKSLDCLYDTIIIDEAQDFPIELIRALSYVCINLNCFMDINQRIVNSHYTKYQDVARILEIRSMYTLRDNFRNTEEIYQFARLYISCNDEIETRRNGEKPLFVKTEDEASLLQTIKTLISNNSASTIGIFTSYDEVEKMLKSIRNIVDKKIQVCAYNRKSANPVLWNVDFSHSGVFIFSTGTMKGLEFDVVIIPRADQLYRSKQRDVELDKNTFYVAATRASEDLYCLYSSNQINTSYIDVFSPLMEHKDLVDWE